MPHSSVGSSEEDIEIPDAPQSSPEESPSDAGSPLPKTEPQSDPIEPPPTARVKKEVKEERGNGKAELEALFADDDDEDEDEDFIGDDDGADLLASEVKVYGDPTVPDAESMNSRICVVQVLIPLT